MEIRKLLQSEKADAMKLVWRVFLAFEAPDYQDEGIQTFRDFIRNENAVNELEMHGAYENGTLLGVIATRNKGSHIALFFVHGKYHRQGIGKKLFQQVLQNSASKTITVNSSPCALAVYHKLGFADTDIEQLKAGIRFIPMKYLR